MHFRIMSGLGAKQAESTAKVDSVFEELKDQMMANESNTVGIIVALLVGLVMLVILFIWTRRKNLGRGSSSLVLAQCCHPNRFTSF